MKKIAGRLIVGATVLILLLAGVAWLTLRASLPLLDGEVRVTGLVDVATIARDAHGIPVITARNRGDLAYATGFAHGQDRYFQMDLIRRQAAGELSEIVGGVALEIDRRYRFHRFRARAAAVIAMASESDRELLQRYADGANAGLASLGARPFEYFVLGAEPKIWQPEDSILVVYAMFTQLNDSRASKEVQRGLVHSIVPDEVYRWMYPGGTSWDAPLMGDPRESAPIPPASTISLRGVDDIPPDMGESGRERLPGSNNWAVSGALTRSGRAIVSNDMHLNLDTPNVYYRARLLIDGSIPLDVSGVTLPGSPFVVAGSNRQVAWGFTNSYGDYTDAVLLKPGETAGSYATPEGDRKFEIHNELIDVKGQDSVAFEVRETIWGPVLEDTDYPGGEIAVSWIAHNPDSINLNFLRLESAWSVADALDIANAMGMPPQNFVTGDAGGNIAWTIAGKIPAKNGFDPMLPADWSEQHGWSGWVAAKDYPRIVNPASGRIWTANSRVTDADALQIVGDGGYDLGARAKQIRDGLIAKNTFDPDDMLNIQFDDRALFLSRWHDLLLALLSDEVVADNGPLNEYRALVNDWIPRAVPESVGYRLVRAFRLDVESRLFHALTAAVREAYGEDVELLKSNQFEGVLWSLVTERPDHMLPAQHESWDAFLLDSVRRNIDYFKENFDGPLANRTWGEINVAAIRHPLARSIPLFGEYLNMPAEQLNGDSDMPKVQGPSMGASERFSVAPGDEENGVLHMPTGASGHPLSSFYTLGHADWVNGLPSPFLPGTAVYTLTLTPDSL